MDLAEKRLLVTGGWGFLGKHLVLALTAQGHHVFVPSREDWDLTDPRQAYDMMMDRQPDVVWHLAARCGGIGANRRWPGTFFRDNMLMGVNVLEAARRYGVDKTILVGTTCSYPKHAPVPFQEDALWEGYPEETNAAYGVAKRALVEMARAYAQEFGLVVPTLILANLYGPGDNFDPATSHVIPALIHRFTEAARDQVDEVTLWGDGTPTREFLYVEDAARALVAAADLLDEEPVNVHGGEEISIAALADLIAMAAGYHGAIAWDTSMPGGQPRRALDGTRARLRLGYEPRVSLEDGLGATVRWYLEQQQARAA